MEKIYKLNDNIKLLKDLSNDLENSIKEIKKYLKILIKVKKKWNIKFKKFLQN